MKKLILAVILISSAYAKGNAALHASRCHELYTTSQAIGECMLNYVDRSDNGNISKESFIVNASGKYYSGSMSINENENMSCAIAMSNAKSIADEKCRDNGFSHYTKGNFISGCKSKWFGGGMKVKFEFHCKD